MFYDVFDVFLFFPFSMFLILWEREKENLLVIVTMVLSNTFPPLLPPTLGL